ncbi:MAG TPA: rhomboid family intramembrane serine protease [Acidimicrobiia bacterium]|nr:rhomboid family intramembrane serine protease [Acidimicrobiia bacterium]
MLPIRDVNPTRIRPLITWAIIAINVFVYFVVQPDEVGEATEFVYQRAAIACELTTGEPLSLEEINRETCTDGSEVPLFPDKNVWVAGFVSMFLHGSVAHILFNMWSLWIFGNNVEEAFGHVGYLLFYVAAGVAATIGFVALNTDLTVPLIGASGAIAGVMGAYLVLFPRHLVLTLIIFRVVAIPAIAFLGFWFFSQFFFATEGVAWEAHVAGFLFGALAALPFRESLLGRTLAGEEQVGTDRSSIF